MNPKEAIKLLENNAVFRKAERQEIIQVIRILEEGYNRVGSCPPGFTKLPPEVYKMARDARAKQAARKAKEK